MFVPDGADREFPVVDDLKNEEYIYRRKGLQVEWFGMRRGRDPMFSARDHGFEFER